MFGSISKTRIGFAVGLASMLAIGGCLDRANDPMSPDTGDGEDSGVDEPRDPSHVASRTLLTTVTLEDGSYIDFVAVAGAIVMSASTKGTGGLAVDALATEEPVDPVTLFERISDEPAPEALVAALARMHAEADQQELDVVEPPPTERMLEPEEAMNQRSQPFETGTLTDSQFRDRYCFSHFIYDLKRCWTYVTGTWQSWWVKKTYVISVAHCYRGGFYHDLLRWNGRLRAWEIMDTAYIRTGWTNTLRAYEYPRRYYKIQVWRGEGDIYHLSWACRP